MSRKTANIVLEGDGLRLVARTGSGHVLVLDDGQGDSGPRPAELVPVAVAACSAMDVVSILRKKRQTITRYEVDATGDQRDEGDPHVFTRLDVSHLVEGPAIDVAAVRRAIELSATRYCSVGGTFATGIVEIHHGYVIRSDGREERGEVVVTGPNEAPDALGQARAAMIGA